MNTLQYRQMGTRRVPAALPYGQLAVAKDGGVFAGNENGVPVEIAKWYGKVTCLSGGNEFGTNAAAGGSGTSVFAAVEMDDFSAATAEKNGIAVPEGASRVKLTMQFAGWKGDYATAKAWLSKNGETVKEVFALPNIPNDMQGTAVEIVTALPGDVLGVSLQANTGSGDNGAVICCSRFLMEVLK